ncbi:MAG TPA: ABC transporter permease [Geminicoccaceae bacterium]|nr:ABC transporter permease [Geminicoccaceae bacterium]
MSFDVIVESLPLYLSGLVTTVWLVGLALMIGLVLSVPLAVLRTSRNPLVNAPVWAYTYFFRGTPLLVQLFMVYYGAGQFEAVRESVLWPLLREAWFCALLVFTLNTAAYTTEIIRGAILATPSGEIEAAKACGMSPALMYRRIVLPSAFRRALPAYGNEVIFMLHGSAVASVITIVDLTGAARIVNSRYYTPYEAFLTVAVFYLALTFLIVFAFRLLEQRLHAHLRRSGA